nr:hypothetical protein [uncultured Alloprevotella sp.]
MEKSVFRVIKDVQVNTPESMQTIQPGKEIKISCVEFAPYGTVKSAATRLNQRVARSHPLSFLMLASVCRTSTSMSESP